MKKIAVAAALILLVAGVIYSAGTQLTPSQKKYYLGDALYYKFAVTNGTLLGALDNNYFYLRDIAASSGFKVSNCNEAGFMLAVESRDLVGLDHPSADSVNWLVSLYGSFSATTVTEFLVSQDTLDANDFTAYDGWMYINYTTAQMSKWPYLFFIVTGLGEQPYWGTYDLWYVVFDFDGLYTGKE